MEIIRDWNAKNEDYYTNIETLSTHSRNRCPCYTYWTFKPGISRVATLSALRKNGATDW